MHTLKQYTPEEIEAIRNQITPIERVHNCHFKYTYIDAEPSPSLMASKRRGEDVHKLKEARK